MQTSESIPARLGRETVWLGVGMARGVFFGCAWFIAAQIIPSMAHDAPWVAVGCAVFAVDWLDRRGRALRDRERR